MQTRLLFVAAAAMLILAAGAPAVAHHAFASEFDGSKPVTLKGTVTKRVAPHGSEGQNPAKRGKVRKTRHASPGGILWGTPGYFADIIKLTAHSHSL